MEIIESFLLGLIQGLTEFLPVSSSGHLALGKALMDENLEKSVTFEVVVHFGTLCSIVVYYRQKLWEISRSLLRFLGRPSEAGKAVREDPNIILSGYILLSMIPAGLIGFTMKDQIEGLFSDPILVSFMLLITGTILFLTRFRTEFPNRLKLGNSFAIGVAQAFAILPGISRSGSTISLGLYLGINREQVANFSFLMVLPVIAGAMLLEVIEMVEMGVPVNTVMDLVIGFFTAFISGYYALKYLIILLRTKGIHPFAWYCWGLGIFSLVYFWA